MYFLLKHIEAIVAGYPGQPPLAIYLKQYFKHYPKLGSRDRKALTEAVFLYFRFARFFPDPTATLDIVGYALQAGKTNNAFLQKAFAGRKSCNSNLYREEINYALPISEGLTLQEWLKSIQQQPRLFIRIRKNKPDVISALEKAHLAWNEMPEISIAARAAESEPACLALDNNVPVDTVLKEQDYVVQDWASQQSVRMVLQKLIHNPPLKVWDVCAGAGGKSIFLKDQLPPFELLATDVRESILHNLQKRFRTYGLNRLQTKVVNVAEKAVLSSAMPQGQFDLVLCDVPCSGSGTWARTPEQFYFFEQKDIVRFEKVQFAIAANAQRYLKPGGLLAYITCSVFKTENEEVVQRLIADSALEVLSQDIINGIGLHADCMFVALFRKKK